MSSPEAIVRAFSEAWLAEDTETFLSGMRAIMREDVRLEQPLASTTVGLDAFEDEFRRVRYLVPDLKGEVTRWASAGETVFIELTLRGTLGGRAISWRLCDRLILADGLCSERASYFDSLPLVWQIVGSPSVWLRWWRSGVGFPGRRFRG